MWILLNACFFDHFDLAKRDLEGCVDIPRLLDGGVGAIFFALYVPVEIPVMRPRGERRTCSMPR